MSGLSSLSGAPVPGLGKMAPGVKSDIGRSSSLGDLPDPLGGRKGGGAGGLDHLDDLFDDEGPSKKDKGKKAKGKLSKGKEERQSKSFKAPKAPLKDESTDEEMFPSSRGRLLQRSSSLIDKSKDMPLMPPSSDSEDGDNTPAFSSLRARRGLQNLEPTSKSVGAVPSIGTSAPSPLDTGDRLASFLKDDVADVKGGLDGDDDFDIFGSTTSRQRTPPGRGRRSAGATPEQTPPTTPPPVSPSVDVSETDVMRNPEPSKSPLGRRSSQADVAEDDFLDLDLPTAPPPIAVKHAAEEAAAKEAAPVRPEKAKGLKQSDEWSLDLDILPEGEDTGDRAPEPATGKAEESKQADSSAAPEAVGGYSPSSSAPGPKRVGRRGSSTAAPAPRASPSPASAAARSRLAEEAKRQMELDLESSGEIPTYSGSGPPPPISASAAAAASAANSRAVAGRRAGTGAEVSPALSPRPGESYNLAEPLSPTSARAAAGQKGFGSSGAELAAMADRHAKEIEVLRAEHKETVEGFQAEVRRLATKLAEGGGSDSNRRQVAELEAKLAEVNAKVESERAKHLEELATLRADAADNIRNLEKIQTLQSENAELQRSVEGKNSQLAELDSLRATLREKEYKLYETGKELEDAKAAHSASLDSATRRIQLEMEDVKRAAAEAERHHKDEMNRLREEAQREAAQKVSEVQVEVSRLKGELEARNMRAAAEMAAAEARGRKEAEEERDRAIRELKARESALEEEREVVQRHAVSAQVLSDLSHKVDSVAANAVEREERIAKQIDRNLKERETVISGRETDLALREESLTTREREAEALRRQLQTVLASLEKTAVTEREELAADKSRLSREQSRLDTLTSTLQDERADLRMQVETEKESLGAAREARLADREALVRELCEERRRVAEERSAALASLDEARTSEHSARRRCFEYEARANAALEMAKGEEARGEAMRNALAAERDALAAGREALEKEKAAIHEESSQLMALGLQVQGRSAELKRLKEEAEYQMRVAEESNASLAAERAGIQAKEQRVADEKRQLNDIRKGLENERLRIATERKALASERVAASKATEAARDIQVKLSLMVRGWAAEGIPIPPDWEAANFSMAALPSDALRSIKRRVAREPGFEGGRVKANHRNKQAARGDGQGAMSNSVRKQMEFLEALKKQQAEGAGVPPHAQPRVAAAPFQWHHPFVSPKPVVSAVGGGSSGGGGYDIRSPAAPNASAPPAVNPPTTHTGVFSQHILALSASSSEDDKRLSRAGMGWPGRGFPPPGRLSNISEQLSPIVPTSSYTTTTTPSSATASASEPSQQQQHQQRERSQASGQQQQRDASATPSSSSAPSEEQSAPGVSPGPVIRLDD